MGANPGSELTDKGEYGTGSFDNIGTAMISIFTSITLEGWVDISYRLLDAFGLPVLTCVYFILMILLGSFFLLNLALAVIEDHYNMEKEAAEDEAESNASDAKNLDLSGEEPEDVPAASDADSKPAGNAFFASVIATPAFDKIIIGSICLNAVTMAMEYHGASSGYNDFLKVCNYIFTFIFVVEMACKILGLTLRGYVADISNVFDAVLVFFAVLEIILVDALGGQAPGGISALRSFRILKLAKSWPALNKLLKTLRSAIVGVSNASVVLLIIVFIFTLLGMQLFGGKFDFAEDPPRHHFDNLWWAFVSVFQVLTGENWNEVLYNGIRATGWAESVIYFTLLNIVGAYIILNLFMAILLGQFDDDDDDESANTDVGGAAAPQGDKKSAKVAPAENSTPNPSGSETSLTARITEAVIGAIEAHRPNSLFSHEQNRGSGASAPSKEAPFKMTGTSLFVLPQTSSFRFAMFKLINHPRFDQFILLLIAVSSVLLAIDEPYLKTDCNWVNSSFVDTLKVLDLIIVILFVLEMVCKVIALGFVFGKDAYLRNGWNCLDFFLVLLSIVLLASEGNESLAALRSLRALRALRPLRVLSRYPGMKLVVNSVFRALPDIVNTTVVCMIFYLIFAIIGVTNWKGALNACNTKDYDGANCKYGVEIPKSHPGLVCGKNCTIDEHYPNGLACNLSPSEHPNGTACTGSFTFNSTHVTKQPNICNLLKHADDQDACSMLYYCEPLTASLPMFKRMPGTDATASPAICNRTFTVERSWSPVGAHFDDVGNALLTVFEVSSGEMWPDIMYNVVDAVTVDGKADLPMCENDENNNCGKEHAPEVAIYFILVTIMCAFLLLNLFVGVVVDNFDKMKKEGISIVTDEQQLWIDSQTMALECAPVRKPNPPMNPLRNAIYKVVESKPFELGIMAMIMLNVVVMAARVFDAPKAHHDTLVALNYVFIVIFAVEAVLKIIGLGPQEYLLRGWCRFDFTLVVLSIVLMEDLGLVGGGLQQYATLARVLRVARMFRLMQTNKQLLTMFKTLVKSFPSIANVACVTLLLFFIYACLGMNLYANLKQTDALNAHANFEGFWPSMYILFRMSTGESYNGLMRDAMVSGDDCSPVVPKALCDKTVDRPSNCGSAAGAPLYFLSFFILSSLLMLNLLVAIILDNFGDTQTFENCAVQHEDLMTFARKWAEFDPRATGFMVSHDLDRFIRTLPLPLGIDPSESNQLVAVAEKVKRMDIPERGGNVSFNEVLSSLCSLAVPQVILPQDLLHSEMMKDLITKKNNIPSISRDDKHQRTVNRDMFEKKGRLYTIQERHFARVIQARLRGVVSRARSAAAAHLKQRDAAVVPQKKEAEV